LYKAFDERMNEQVLELYQKDHRWGIEMIWMKLKKIHGTFTTKATVYRYMKLNDIQSIIRKKTKRYSKVNHHRIPNLLQRDFTTEHPNQKWSIDVSYLPTTQTTLYLCAIKDLHDKSIISYCVSFHNDMKLVLDTLKQAAAKVKRYQRKGLILHSDQGSQFISPYYHKWLRRFGIKHSVSAKGSCVDNCPIESFFSQFKSECMHLHHQISNQKMIELVNDYISYYNEERISIKIKELTPYEYRKSTLKGLFLDTVRF
jgi:transposase InsO family protein